MLIAAGTVLGLFASIFVYETYVSPPLQVFGVCPPPAQLTGAGCVQTTTTIVNGQQQTGSHSLVVQKRRPPELAITAEHEQEI